MSTGSFENWAGNIADIGPIYPFVGSEFVLWIVGLVLWIIWHIWQSKIESDHYQKDMYRFGNTNSLKKIIEGENPENP